MEKRNGYQPIKSKSCKECPNYNNEKTGNDRYNEKECKNCKNNTPRPDPPISGSCFAGPTNIALFEVEVLKDKLKYIKDLCLDALREPKELNRQLMRDIIDICDNKTCNNCKWWEKENITKGMVCVNADSKECSNWTNANQSCKNFEKIKREDK